MPRQTVTFLNPQRLALAGVLEIPPAKVPINAYAVFAACFTCGKEIPAAARIARELAAQGIAVLRFDFAGLGDSEGDFADTHFSSNVEDIIAACAFLAAEHEAPALLIGHSLGGAAVLVAADKINSVKAVVTVAAPATASHVEHLFADSKAQVMQNGEAEVQLAGRAFRFRREFFEDLDRYTDCDHIRAMSLKGKALLIFHSPVDDTVSISEASRIYRMAKHPKSFVTLDNAEHLLVTREDAKYVASVAAQWACRYLDVLAQPEVPRPAKGEVTAEEIDHAFQLAIRTHAHDLLADEPKSFGGQDTGPSPYEFLLASLGACTAMTVRMVAERRDLPLEDVKVSLEKALLPASDNPKDKRKTLQINRRVQLIGTALSEDARKTLMHAANRCPVHKSLTGEIEVLTEQV